MMMKMIMLGFSTMETITIKKFTTIPLHPHGPTSTTPTQLYLQKLRIIDRVCNLYLLSINNKKTIQYIYIVQIIYITLSILSRRA